MLSKKDFQLFKDNYNDLRDTFDMLSSMGDVLQHILSGQLDEIPEKYPFLDQDEVKDLMNSAQQILKCIVYNLSCKKENESVTDSEMQLAIMYVESIDLLLKKLKPADWQNISSRYNDMVFLLLEIIKQLKDEQDD